MPKSTVTEFDTNDLYPIPVDLPVPVQLQAVTVETVEFTYKQGPNAGKPGSFLKWQWDFMVYDGEYAGTTFRASTEPKITNATESDFLPLARPLVEALKGRALEVGEEVDTDDLIGAKGLATVKHLPPRPRKSGEGNWYNVELNELFPSYPDHVTQAASAPTAQSNWGTPSSAAQYDEPPY